MTKFFSQISKIDKKILWLLFILIIIAVWLRLPGKEGHSAYAYHELPRDLAVIKNISIGDFPLYGTRSSLNDFHFGPIYYYLYFPLAAIFHFAPYSLALTSLFFSILTILLGFFVVKKWWGNYWLALLFVFLMTFSLADVQFAKYGSNPNPIPFFVLLFFYSLKNLYDNRRPILNTFILAVSFGVATQLHAVPLICLPIILFVSLILKKIKVNFLETVIFIFTNLVLYFPYLFFEITHNFYNFRQLVSNTQVTTYSAGIVERLIYFLGFLISPFISTNIFFDAPYLIGHRLVYLIIAFLLFVWATLRLDKKFSFKTELSATHDNNLKTIFKLWLIIPSLVLIIPLDSVTALNPYYFFILSPWLFIILALGIYKIFARGFRITAIYLLFFFLVLQLVQYGYYQKIFVS